MPFNPISATAVTGRAKARASRLGQTVFGFALPEHSAGFSNADRPRLPGICSQESYRPTWWLSADVERRRAAYFPMVTAVACEAGVPLSLLDAMIAQESGYKFWALSSAGAMGIMQLMPETARAAGLSAVFDPLANMRAGARYLRDQLDRFGRVDLALAAYNAGPARRSLLAGMIPAIPETVNYVRTITTNWARLAQMRADVPASSVPQVIDRGAIAAAAVRASGYREVELNRYDGMNAENPI